MNKLFILTATSLTLALASPALASNDDEYCGETSGQWLSQDVIYNKATEKGYDVRKIKREGSCYEVYAIDQNGARFELYINPVTGEIVRTKNKS